MNVQSKRSVISEICYAGMLSALVFVATRFINVRLPISINGGLIHLGNVPLVVASIVFGKRVGAVSGAVGMTLFDVLSGWAVWAPFTFVVRAVMGYLIGVIAEKKHGEKAVLNLAAVIAGGVWMIIGYYFSEVILYSNFISPISSIPGNAVQVVSAVVVGLPLATGVGAALKRGGVRI
jgi:uncharacterized membrane protein